MSFIPRVADISHWTDVEDLNETAKVGVWGIICKCTEGTNYVDPSYKTNRQKALDAGLLWGAYHFNNGADPHEQFDHFMSHAQVDDKTLMALDYEHNDASRSASNMSPDQMVEFLRYGEKTLGRKLVIYSGNYLKEAMPKLSKEDRVYVCQHRLWLAQYSSVAHLPIGFEKWWLHQYTGDGFGPTPHFVPGLGGEGDGLDLNRYEDDKNQLTLEWAS